MTIQTTPIKTTASPLSDDDYLKIHAEKRTRCLIYTRVMGYHRPVESFNIGKKGEHTQRVFFKE